MTVFCTFLCRRCTTHDVKLPYVTFCGDESKDYDFLNLPFFQRLDTDFKNSIQI